MNGGCARASARARVSRAALAGRKPRRQAHLCAGRAGFRRRMQFARYLPLLAAARRRGDAARAPATRASCCAKACRASRCSATAVSRRPISATRCCSACRSCSRPGSKPSPPRYLICARRRRRRSRWTSRRSASRSNGFKVGLVWAGNPEHVNDHRRSVDLAAAGAAVRRGRRIVCESASRSPPRDLKRLKRGNVGIADLATDLAISPIPQRLSTRSISSSRSILRSRTWPARSASRYGCCCPG